MKTQLLRWMFTFLIGGALAGCAHGTRPDDLSAAEHEAKAKKETEKAEKNEESAANIPAHGKGGGQAAQYRSSAERLREHAREHEAAAEALRKFEAEECTGVPPEAKVQCPLMRVEKVEDVSDGIVLRLKADANADESARQMRCHLAYARSQGYAGMEDCPFYMRGVSVTRVEGQNAVRLTSGDAKTVASLQEQAREMSAAEGSQAPAK